MRPTEPRRGPCCHPSGRHRPPPWGFHANPESLVLSLLRYWSPISSLFLGRHNHDAGVGYRITGGAVGLGVKSDQTRFRDLHAGVDNGALDAAVTADLHSRHQNRVVHFAIAVHVHAGRQDAAHHAAAGNDTTAADDGIERHTHAAAFRREDELRGRLLGHAAAHGPLLIV